MELRHLRYFVGVAEELHFARAAARLGISQPPLSQQIRALEDELGVRLFDRNSRNVTLTSAGALFLTEAKATLAQADRAVTIARRAARGEVGELAVGFNASAPFVPKVARAIFAFRQTCPDIHLTLAELPRPAQFKALQDGSLDIGFVRSPQPPQVPDGITATPLLNEGLFVAMRPDHRLAERATLSLGDLAGEPMLVYGRDLSGGFTDELFRLFRVRGIDPVIAQDVREVATLFGLAAAGVGITILAESLCTLQPAKLAYRPLVDEDALTALWLLHLKDGITLPCQRFLEVIRSEND